MRRGEGLSKFHAGMLWCPLSSLTHSTEREGRWEGQEGQEEQEGQDGKSREWEEPRFRSLHPTCDL